MNEKTQTEKEYHGYYDPYPPYVPTPGELEEIRIKRFCLLEMRDYLYREETKFIEYLYKLRYVDKEISDLAGVNDNRISTWRAKNNLSAYIKPVFIHGEKLTKKDQEDLLNKKNRDLERFSKQIEKERKKYDYLEFR